MDGKRETRIMTAREPSVDIRIPCDVQGHLGIQLRAAYAKLVREPIPERLLDLLRKLEAKERAW